MMMRCSKAKSEIRYSARSLDELKSPGTRGEGESKQRGGMVTEGAGNSQPRKNPWVGWWAPMNTRKGMSSRKR